MIPTQELFHEPNASKHEKIRSDAVEGETIVVPAVTLLVADENGIGNGPTSANFGSNHLVAMASSP